jgi:quinol monooxygenase YgiN
MDPMHPTIKLSPRRADHCETGAASRNRRTPEMVHMISPFEISSEDEEAFLDGWKRLIEWLRAKAGFRAARLHRSASSTARFRYVGMSIWDDQAAITAVMGDPDFLALSESIPVPISPSVYQLIEEVTGTR